MSANFPAPSRLDWETLAQETTRGVDTDKALTTRTYDGIEIRPLYDRMDLEGLPIDSLSGILSTRDWEIRQLAVLGDDAFPLDEIEAEGADGLLLKIPDAVKPSDFKQFLEGRELGIFLFAGPRCFEVADAYLGAKKAGLNQGALNQGSKTSASLNIDPLGVLARYGQLEKEPETALKSLSDYVDVMDGVTPIGVDASIYSEAGATEAEQLSLALSTGVSYLRALTEGGVDIEKAASSIEFTFAVSPMKFRTIAFLRAFRICWRQILQASGLETQAGQPPTSKATSKATSKIHALTSAAYLTKQDVWVNILRATSACFGAVLGGADSVTLLPFDYDYGKSNTISRRLSANISHILKRESQINRVQDPARGSYYLESLTHKLAKAGWGRFQEIEKHGSHLELLKSGKLHKIVENSWQKQAEDIATRKSPIVGVSEFANLADGSAELGENREPWQEISSLENMPNFCEPLKIMRRAEPYEMLLNKSQLLKEETGLEPTVFCANLGTPAEYNARFNFAQNFFSAGGITPLSSSKPNPSLSGAERLSDAEVIAKEFKKSKATKESKPTMAVICGTDSQYESMLSGKDGVLAALRDSGCDRIYLAGSPKGISGGVDLSAVDEFIYRGCDALSILNSALDFLAGIEDSAKDSEKKGAKKGAKK